MGSKPSTVSMTWKWRWGPEGNGDTEVTHLAAAASKSHRFSATLAFEMSSQDSFYGQEGSWHRMRLTLEGVSALEQESLGVESPADAIAMLETMGFRWEQEEHRAELDRLQTHAVGFIRDLLLEDRLGLHIPHEVAEDYDTPQLLIAATQGKPPIRQWCCAVWRAMHVLRHCKNFLLERYGDVIREQILGRFERIVIHSGRGPVLGVGPDRILLDAVEVQRTKPLQSVALKLLRHPDSVATDIEDYIGIRFVTENRFDAVRVLDYLLHTRVLTLACIKPRRVRNTLFDLEAIDEAMAHLERRGIEDAAIRRAHLHHLLNSSQADPKPRESRNPHRHDQFHSLMLTARQLVRAPDPQGEAIFFFPYEVQIIDKANHKLSRYGPAGYKAYRERQIEAARHRILGSYLLDKAGHTPKVNSPAADSEPQTELFPPDVSNREVAELLKEIATLLEVQHANSYRIEAYRAASQVIRKLERSVQDIALSEGRSALVELPRIGTSLSSLIDEVAHTGRMRLLERLEGGDTPNEVFSAIPGIGDELSARIHAELHIDTLEELEVAAHDGRLDAVAGFGPKRLAIIQKVLEHRIHRSPRGEGRRFEALKRAGATVELPAAGPPEPNVGLLLQVDADYRLAALAGSLPTVAPRRNNPSNDAWLPIMHTDHDGWRFTAMFSNSDRAHATGHTRDWVILYFESGGYESQCTVVAGEGALTGQRVIHGREADCLRHYESLA